MTVVLCNFGCVINLTFKERRYILKSLRETTVKCQQEHVLTRLQMNVKTFVFFYIYEGIP
jgi:hypothetical protein